MQSAHRLPVRFVVHVCGVLYALLRCVCNHRCRLCMY